MSVKELRQALTLSLAVVLVAATCSPEGSVPSVAPTPSATLTVGVSPLSTSSAAASTGPIASPLLPGTVMSMTAEPEMIAFFADGGSLYTWWQREGLPPYLSKIMRADPASGTWRTVYETDAHTPIHRVSTGSLALLEYREPPQGGGAYSQDLTLLDLATGAAAKKVDSWALSAATFRGGGAATRRPVGSVALGPRDIAWTRLVERPGGKVEGELRHSPLGDLGRARAIRTSSEWISPVGFAGSSLIYVLGGTAEDQLHAVDLVSGADRTILTSSAQEPNGFAFQELAIAGSWIGWVVRDSPPATPGAPAPRVMFRAIDVTTGEQRMLDPSAECGHVTANARYFVLSCDLATSRVLDTARWSFVAVLPTGVGGAVGLQATQDAFLWFERVGSAGRRVHLLRF